MPKKSQIISKRVPKHENNSIEKPMDAPKVQTNGVVSGYHSNEMAVTVPDSKTVDNKTTTKTVNQTSGTSSTANDVSTAQSSSQAPTQPIVPPLVLTQKSVKNDKKSQNSFAIVGKKLVQNKEEVRRVTRHSPQNSTTVSSAKAQTSNSTTNGRAQVSALLSPLSSPNKNSKQIPIVAHKRSPSSPLTNQYISAAIVRATKSQPTPVLRANFMAAQKAKAEANSLPKVETKRPKRKLESKKVSAKAAVSPVEENGEQRASKRVRLQYQPFQSPEPLSPLPLLYRASTSSAPKNEKEEKLIIYQNNEFLAVRNETNSFFICRAKQNVFRNSRKFKIQWFNNDSNPAVYIPDFYDVTDFECVLTNLTLDRVDKGQYSLPTEERQRILNILQRAINVEKGINVMPDPNKVTADGVDISIVGKVDEKELMKKISPKRVKQTVTKTKKQSMVTSAGSVGTNSSPKVSTRLTKRIVKKITTNGPSSASNTPSPTKTLATRTAKVTSNSKLSIRRSTRSTGSKTPNVSPVSSKSSPKGKKPGIADVVKKLKTRARTAKKQEAEQKKSLTPIKRVTKKLVSPKKKQKVVTPVSKTVKPVLKQTPSPKAKRRPPLQPNPNVTLYEKDPFFESNKTVPFISTSVDSKLLIRAVLLRDGQMLERLINDKKKICSFCVPRCLAIDRTALSYAIEIEDFKAIKLLMDEKLAEGLAPFPDVMITGESTGHGSKYMFGHALRTVNICRGGREGNNALLQDSNDYSTCITYFSEEHAIDAIENGIKFSTIEKLSAQVVKHPDELINLFLDNIVCAVRHGQCKLAHDLVELALKRGGFGFNELHKQSLSKGKQFPKFRTVSVLKKSMGNSRITPIHCAAINPDPYFMTTLLSQKPDYGVLDLQHWTPIHYAAVSEGSSNLDYLLTHGVSSLIVEKEGNTPMHLACARNRPKNVEVIARHELKSAESSGGTAVSTLEKLNRAGFSPLHVAAQGGFTNVVKELLKAGADAEKPTATVVDKLTPIMVAARFGHLNVVKLLVECGVNVEAVDKKQRTALTMAVMNGHSHVVSYLLRLGANPNTKDSSGNLLIHYACAYGWYFCFRLLIEAKARPNDTNDWKMTPLCIAFMKGHTGLAEAIIKETNIDINIPVNDSDGMNLLMQSCESKPNELMIERLKFLIERGADCTRTDFNGNSALHYLVINESKVLKSDRRRVGENLEATDSDSDSYHPFECRELLARKQRSRYMATHHKEIREANRQTILTAAQILLDKGCDPSAVNKQNMSPFMSAAELGSFSLLQKLLDLNRKQLNSSTNRDGNTILHLFVSHAINEITVQNRKISVGKYIKDIYETDDSLKTIFGEMSVISNKRGLKPIHLFIQTYSGHYSPEETERLIDYLRFLVETLESDINSAIVADKPENVESIPHLISSCKSKEIVELVLSKKPNLELLNGHKRTALTLSIINKNSEISKLLIASGADVKFKSVKDSNLSLLLLEAKNNTQNFELIPLLVAKGADVNEAGEIDCNRAIHYVAARAEQKGASEAVTALISAGADVNAINKLGRTPLHLAVNCRRGGTDISFDVEERLLKAGAKTDIKDERGRIALHYVFVKISNHRDHSFMDPIELVALLDPSDGTNLQENNIDIADNFGSTPLHYAAQRGATISCMHLLRRVNINPIDDNNNTPLGLAVLYGHEGCALMLQQKGAAFIKPVGNLNRKPDLRFKEEKSFWKWNKLKEEERLSRELEVKKAICSIIEEVVRNDWQGILYLMINELATIGKGVGIAVEAALKTSRLNLAIKLLKRVKQNKSLYSTEQTLLHVMAKECMACETNRELQQLIVKLLVEREVPVLALDSQFKSNAIIYAAINWNYILCNQLTDLLGLEKVVALEPDLLLRTPLTAIFWDIYNKASDRALPEPMQIWMTRLLEKNSQQMNALTYFPIFESNYAGVRFVASNPTPSSITGAPKYSPLIFAVICGNYSLVKYLLNLKINGSYVVDINFADCLGRTPLMHSVRLNDLKMVKLLLNRSYSPEDDIKVWDSRSLTFENKNGVDLASKDQNGWTVLHHLVSPLPNFTYLNADVVLRLIWQVSNNSKHEIRLFDVTNNSGETPVQIAVNRNAENLMKTFKELINSETDKQNETTVLPPFPKIETNFIDEKFDYKSDSLKMVEKFESELMETVDTEPMFRPDGLTAMENAEVVIDTTIDLPFDVLLTKVDIEYGVYGLYNFYKMQIIEQKTKDLVLLFTRWGRIGDIGQYQKTPFSTMDDAIKEFKKVFKAKTGNNWETVKQFSALPKKYRLVEVQRRVRQKQNYYKIDVSSALKTVEQKLPEPLFELMKTLITVHSNEGTFRAYGNSESCSPFGLLKNETLTTAESVLQKIERLIEEKEKIKQKDSSDYLNTTNEIVDLSEEFYHLVPLFGYQLERLSPMMTREELREKQQLIVNLIHFEYAFELLLGAQYRAQDVNPADYIYRCLGCHLQLLDRNEEESQLILQYIHNTGHKPVVKAIYRINRNGEEDRFKSGSVGNNWLLWHGTKVANVLSILANGLMKAPLSAQISGHLFGKGIYFADMFTKSQNYCSGFGEKFMFLSEVSLGDIEKVQLKAANNDILKPIANKEKHSLKTSHSLYRPDPQSCVYWKGRSVPMGPSVRNHLDSNEYHELNYNEYIVFNCSQICIRYLIQFND